MIDYNIQDDLLRKALSSATMTDIQIIERDLREWLGTSRKRQLMVTGNEYYADKQDIRLKTRLAPMGNEKPVEITGIPNNKILDNVYAELVDLKTNYAFGKDFIVDYADRNETDAVIEENLQKYITPEMQLLMRDTCADFLNGGISYWFPYYEGTELRFKLFRSYSIIPYFADERRTVLEMAVYHYQQIQYEGTQAVTVDKVEVYYPDRVDFYEYRNGALTPDVERGITSSYLTAMDGEEYNWGVVPVIPFKYNSIEKPLISKIKSLQDAINRLQSDFMDNMQEDGRNTVLVLKNYGGTDFTEFRRNLAAYGVIKVNADKDGGNGGVDTLKVDVNSENYDTILRLLKKAVIKNGRGFDAMDDRVGTSPNQLNIQSMYSYIDLDTDGLEREFQLSFKNVLKYIAMDMRLKGLGELDAERVTVKLNRNMMFNMGEQIDNLVKSVGIISRRTILANHPLVNDVQEEIELLEQELKEQTENSEMFSPVLGEDRSEAALD